MTIPTIAYTGAWHQYSHPAASAGHLTYSRQTGARAELAFYGTGLRWTLAMGPMAGKAGIYLDGAWLGTVDLYSPSPRLQTLTREGLPRALRTITIEVSGEKNPSSTDHFVDIDAFEVVP